jgi:hypothetical protein
MAILERNFAAHLGVRREGTVVPFCQAWRSTWNWTMERDHVTCPQCLLALTKKQAGAPDKPA